MKRGPKKLHSASFKAGVSGNPAGRKPGVKDWRGKLREEMEKEAPMLLDTALYKAKEGDKEMLKFCLDKIIPNIRFESVAKGVVRQVTKSSESLIDASIHLSQKIEQSEISPELALKAQQFLEGHARIINAVNLEERVKQLEETLINKK